MQISATEGSPSWLEANLLLWGSLPGVGGLISTSVVNSLPRGWSIQCADTLSWEQRHPSQLCTNTRQSEWRSRVILFAMAIPGGPRDLCGSSRRISAGLQVPGQKAEAVSGALHRPCRRYLAGAELTAWSGRPPPLACRGGSVQQHLGTVYVSVYHFREKTRGLR